MLKIVETFSGIGAQSKALKNSNIDFKVIATADWDINAIIAYDLIHHGPQNLEKYQTMTKEEIVQKLQTYTLSMDGKKPTDINSIFRLKKEILEKLLCAINRSNNLGSITDIKGKDLPNDIDLLTYSFPCQDLSVAGYWHGNKGGIDRNANNRSSMLWQVERILNERQELNIKLPKFLLMENVSSILSTRHIENFNEWKESLEEKGYYNKVYKLNASNFGIPQKRVRVYMISIFTGNDPKKNKNIDLYFKNNNLEDENYIKSLNIKKTNLKSILKTDYSNHNYFIEALLSQPNDTMSRRIIFEKSDLLYDGSNILEMVVPTITTKQDRYPNSGLLNFCNKHNTNLSNFRYLTPRECFLLMGFDEKDYEVLINNNVKKNSNHLFFSRDKLNKMAGNSIVVNVLEEIFKQINEINEDLL